MEQTSPKRTKWTQESGARLSVQLGVALLSLFVLAWLWNIVDSHPKGWTDGTIESWMSRTAWIVVLLMVLVLLILIEILLFGPVKQAIEREIMKRNDPLLTLGCPSCGTVFDWQAKTALDGRFECPHCARVGHVPMSGPISAHIDDLECINCAYGYRAYHRISECPHCHHENLDERIADSHVPA